MQYQLFSISQYETHSSSQYQSPIQVVIINSNSISQCQFFIAVFSIRLIPLVSINTIPVGSVNSILIASIHPQYSTIYPSLSSSKYQFTISRFSMNPHTFNHDKSHSIIQYQSKITIVTISHIQLFSISPIPVVSINPAFQ